VKTTNYENKPASQRMQGMHEANSFRKQKQYHAYENAMHLMYQWLNIKMMDRRITHHPVMNFFDAQLLITLKKVYKMTETGKRAICQTNS